jgi:hypothetical protein
MATILKFRASDEDGAARSRRRRGRTGEVVIFPGVRYERWRETEQKSEMSKPVTPRDVLKLVD